MSIDVSKEQMLAVMHGTPTNASWHPIALPEGPQELPSWALGLRVDWMTDFANRPKVDILTDGTEYEGKWLYEYHPDLKLYIAEKDGCIQWFRHGPLSLQVIDYYDPELKKRVNGELWTTSQDQGFAGRWFWINMVDGRRAALRGPWHVSCPPGYVEVTNYKYKKPNKWDIRNYKHRKRLLAEGKSFYKDEPLPPSWSIGTFGMAISND